MGQVALEADDLGAAVIPALQTAWKVATSRPLWLALAALFGWLYFQEWSAHRVVAHANAEHRAGTPTKESTKWVYLRGSCIEVGGPVMVVDGAQLTDEELLRLADEHGLVLDRTITREIPGPERIVFRDAAGQPVRLLGEHELAAMPWGAKLAAGLKQDGALWTDAKPYPEPFNERLSQWVVSGMFGYGWSEQAQASAPVVGLSGEFVWRRFGRWEVGPIASATYGFGGIGGEALIALKVSRRDLPLRLRAVSP